MWGKKTTETFIDSFLMLTTRTVDMFLPIKSVEGLRKELQNDYDYRAILNNCQAAHDVEELPSN